MLQSQVSPVNARFVLGQFWNSLPRNVTSAKVGAASAAPRGVSVGRACWRWQDAANGAERDEDGRWLNVVPLAPSSSTPPLGFVVNSPNVMTWRGDEYALFVPPGRVAEIITSGAIVVRNEGARDVTIGMAAYCSILSGAVEFWPTGQSHVGFVESAWKAQSGGAFDDLIRIADKDPSVY